MSRGGFVRGGGDYVRIPHLGEESNAERKKERKKDRQTDRQTDRCG